MTVDYEFWFMAISFILLGWCARSAMAWFWAEEQRRAEISRARALHPSSKPKHVWLLEDQQLRLWDD